jgi:ubiquinone/menaquinone biosynthesis C-methylase UbiE
MPLRPACLGLALLACAPAHAAEGGGAAATAAAPAPYTQGVRHRGGIGTYFMGREIAQVMGHEGADWLDRPQREAEENPKALVAALDLKSTDVVADIGTGTGYYAFRMAPQVGRVLAEDIQQEMLDLLAKKAASLGVANVVPVLGTITDPKLPPAGVDVVLLVDVYHEFDHPAEMMTAIRAALRPGGHVVQVEFRGEDPAVPILTLHKMSEKQARSEMESFGLTWERTIESLPWQHVLIYRK